MFTVLGPATMVLRCSLRYSGLLTPSRLGNDQRAGADRSLASVNINMKPPVSALVHLLVGLLVAILGAAESVRGVSATRLEPASAQGAPQHDTQPAPKKDPLLKLAQPWPSADEMRRAKADAETRPLFATTDPLS